jgi:hypothetical protein
MPLLRKSSSSIILFLIGLEYNNRIYFKKGDLGQTGDINEVYMIYSVCMFKVIIK